MAYGYPGYGYGGYFEPSGGCFPPPSPFSSPLPPPQQKQQGGEIPPKTPTGTPAQMPGEQGGQPKIFCRPAGSIEEG